MNASTVDPEIIPGELVKAKKPEIPNGIVTRVCVSGLVIGNRSDTQA
jgi:hypothetical protein